jgi:hypothetical protein
MVRMTREYFTDSCAHPRPSDMAFQVLELKQPALRIPSQL